MHLKRRTKFGPLDQIRIKSDGPDASPICQRFFEKISGASACCLVSIFSLKYQEFSIFRRFFQIFSDFFSNRLSVADIILGSADNRFFDDISTGKI